MTSTLLFVKNKSVYHHLYLNGDPTIAPLLLTNRQEVWPASSGSPAVELIVMEEVGGQPVPKT